MTKTLSPKYARRIELALKKGLTLQQARGHKAKEHVARREREVRVFGGLTGDQIRSIRRWYSTSFDPTGQKQIRNAAGKRGPSVENLIDLARKNGYTKFAEYKKVWAAKRRTYIREQSKGTYASRGEAYGEELPDDMEPLDSLHDIGWLYYH